MTKNVVCPPFPWHSREIRDLSPIIRVRIERVDSPPLNSKCSNSIGRLVVHVLGKVFQFRHFHNMIGIEPFPVVEKKLIT